MDKNEFDVDFDFEKEYGFDPKAFLGTEEYDENIDLSTFTDEELGLNAKPAPKKEESQPTPAGFDLDEDLKDFLSMGDPGFSLEDDLLEEEEEEDYVLSEAAVEDSDTPDDDYFSQELTAPEEACDQEEVPSYDEDAVSEDPIYGEEPE